MTLRPCRSSENGLAIGDNVYIVSAPKRVI